MRPHDRVDKLSDEQRFHQIAGLLAAGLRRLRPSTPCSVDLSQQAAAKNLPDLSPNCLDSSISRLADLQERIDMAERRLAGVREQVQEVRHQRIDEEEARQALAAFNPVWQSLTPLEQGRLVALSTPFGKRGWYHDEWFSADAWQRVKITAEECPRISAAFLAEERRALGERWYWQEYLCSFEDTVDAVFSWADIQAAFSDDLEPLFPEV